MKWTWLPLWECRFVFGKLLVCIAVVGQLSVVSHEGRVSPLPWQGYSMSDLRARASLLKQLNRSAALVLRSVNMSPPESASQWGSLGQRILLTFRPLIFTECKRAIWEPILSSSSTAASNSKFTINVNRMSAAKHREGFSVSLLHTGFPFYSHSTLSRMLKSRFYVAYPSSHSFFFVLFFGFFAVIFFTHLFPPVPECLSTGIFSCLWMFLVESA